MSKKAAIAIALSMALSFVLAAAATAQDRDMPMQIPAPAKVQNGQAKGADAVLPYHPTRLLVQFTEFGANALTKGGGPQALQSFESLSSELGGSNLRRAYDTPANLELAVQLGVDRWYMLDVNPGDMEAAAEQLRQDPNVAEAFPDYRAFYYAVPNDPIYPSQWGHNNTGQMLDYCWFCGGHPAGNPVGTPGFDANAQAAWDAPSGYGSSSVIIAILDSGVDIDHPDLVGNLVAGYDFGDNDPNPDDNSADPGHGTACAGVAAAVANNNLGVAGIAGNCSLMPLKVADSAGILYFSYITNALYYAGDNDVDVASMSFGAAVSSYPPTDAALTYAHNNGVTLLAATGNENASTIGYPANHAMVIGVGAASPCGDRKRSSSNTNELNPGVFPDPNGYTCDGERWWGSNYGVNTPDHQSAVDVIAPTILPTTDIAGSGGYDPGDYDMWFNGTSAATPYAAGVCGLIKSANPGFTSTEVRDELVDTAQDITNVESGAGWDRYSGYGMVDAEAAVGGGGCTVPAAPGRLSANAVGQTQINLVWQDNSNNESDFLVERDSGGGFVQIAALGANTTNYSDTGLDCETAYNYRVRAFNACGYSGYSNTNGDTTDDCPAGSSVVGEVGQVVRNQTGAGADWYTVNLNNSYTNPVVTMRGLSTNGGHKTHLRARSVGSTSFQWQQEEWDYHDGNHTTETCPYMVMEAGRHTLEDGTEIEAGTVNLTNGTWATVNFSSSFSGTPVLLTGVMSDNDNAAVITRSRNLGSGSFQIKLQEEEAGDNVHATETVGWIAIDAGTGTNDGATFEAARTPNAVTDANYTINFSAGFGSAPIFLCHDDTYDGGNTCGTRYRTLNASSATVFIEEEQSADSEIAHISEVVSWVAWGGAGDIVAQGSGLQAGLNLSSKDVPVHVAVPFLAQNRPNPFSGTTRIAYALPEASPVKVQVFDLQGRLVATLIEQAESAGDHELEWDGLDKNGVKAPAGIYFYRLTAGKFTETRRLTLIH